MLIAISFRLGTFDEHGYTTNPTLLEDLFMVWTQTELSYSLVSATIPTLRPVMNNLNTQFGGLGLNIDAGYGYPSTYDKTTGTYQMSNLRSMDKKNTRNERSMNRPQGDPREHTYSYGVDTGQNEIKRTVPEHANGDATSVDSDDSRQMIIRKDITFDVRYEYKE